MTSTSTPVNILMILDGWGINEHQMDGNAAARADTPFLDHLLTRTSCCQLACSGPAVGLPVGTMGNSEVGHMNIGAGRRVLQDLIRINAAIEDRTLFDNPVLTAAMDTLKQKGKALHLMGLLSDGGVHSHISHTLALVDMARIRGVKTVYIHAILDGRDTPPKSGITYMNQLVRHLDQYGFGRVKTITGRYWTMDRDTRWDRVQKGYDLMTAGKGNGIPILWRPFRPPMTRVKPMNLSPRFLLKTAPDPTPVPSRTKTGSSFSISGQTGPKKSPGPSLKRDFLRSTDRCYPRCPVL